MKLLKLALIAIGMALAVGSVYSGIDGFVILVRGGNIGKYSPWLFALLNFFFILFGVSLFFGCIQLVDGEKRTQNNRKAFKKTVMLFLLLCLICTSISFFSKKVIHVEKGKLCGSIDSVIPRDVFTKKINSPLRVSHDRIMKNVRANNLINIYLENKDNGEHAEHLIFIENQFGFSNYVKSVYVTRNHDGCEMFYPDNKNTIIRKKLNGYRCRALFSSVTNPLSYFKSNPYVDANTYDVPIFILYYEKDQNKRIYIKDIHGLKNEVQECVSKNSIKSISTCKKELVQIKNMYRLSKMAR